MRKQQKGQRGTDMQCMRTEGKENKETATTKHHHKGKTWKATNEREAQRS